MKVGAGTTPGGYQIQSMKPVARGSGHLIHTTVPHGTQLWVTAVATNHAGLTTTFSARPITVDHKGPVIDILDVVAEQVDINTIDYNVSSRQYVVRANWTVADSESGVKSCYCSFGKQGYIYSIIRILISIIDIYSPDPMFDHMLESSHQDDSNTW